MTRRWEPREFELDGLRWRVVLGRKESRVPGEVDLRLEHMTPNGWRPTAMALLFMLADFWYENEDILYPRPRWQGADYLLRAVRRATQNGYESEITRLEDEKAAKRAREAVPQLPTTATLRPQRAGTKTVTTVSGPTVCATYIECDNEPEWHCLVCSKHLLSPYIALCSAHMEVPSMT